MHINDASIASGLSHRMIRHYEVLGLIPPPARKGKGYRTYTDADVRRMRFIATARDVGFDVDQIKNLLGLWADQERSNAEVVQEALMTVADISKKLQSLEALRSTVIDLASRRQVGDRPTHPFISLEGELISS